MASYLPLGLEIGAGSLLALMGYQDWQTRSISWPAFPVLAALLVTLRLQQAPAAQVALQVAVSWGALATLLAVLTLYVRLRFRGLRLRDCLGSGDVLYWGVAALYFAPAGFLLYFLVSSAVALVVAGLAQWRRPAIAGEFRIPLAGVQATCLLVLMGGQNFAVSWSVTRATTDLLMALTP